MSVPRWFKARRAALAGSVVIMLFAAALVAAPFWVAFSAQAARITEATAQLGRLRSLAATASAWQARRDEMQRAAETAPGLLAGDTAALAGAQLQGRLTNLISGHDGQVRSAQILAPQEDAGFERISVQSDFSLPMRQLAVLARAVESDSPYLFIASVAVSGPRDLPLIQPPAAGGPAVMRRDPGEPKLDVRWTVHGYRRPNT